MENKLILQNFYEGDFGEDSIKNIKVRPSIDLNSIESECRKQNID